ncbi:ATP-binding protein [Chloroflexota bacterium]
MEWQVAMTALLSLLGKTIYRPENVLVELAANSYDADASRVEITSSGESQMIQVKDDRCGMDLENIEELVTVAKSKKRTMMEQGLLTPIYKRRPLGCFGIGIISFLSLGRFIKVFTPRLSRKG